MLGDLEQSIPSPFLLLVLLLLLLAGVVGVPHLISFRLLFWLFLFLFLLLLLLLELYGDLALSQLFCILWVIFLEEIGLFDVFHLEVRERPYLFVFGHSFIIGRVVKGFKADVEGRSFLGTKHSCLSTDYIDNIKILVVLFGEWDVDSCRQAPIDSF